MIAMIKRNPTPAPARDSLESAEVGQMALPPCHCLFQFYVASAGFPANSISVADVFLGVPFNIASYAL